MKVNVKKIAIIGVFSAISFVLMFLELSIPIVPSFLKFDISELPALLISFMFGPLSGTIVCLIKNLLHLTVGHTGGVGELSNFLLGAVLCLVSGFVYKIKKTKTNAIVSILTGCVAMALTAFPINLFIVYPFYYNIMSKEAILGICKAILPSVSSIEESLWIFNVPFTFVKGIVCGIITYFTYKKLRKILIDR